MCPSVRQSVGWSVTHELKSRICPILGGEIQAYIGRNLEEIATEAFLTEMESLEYVLTHGQLLPQDFSFVAAVCSSIFKSMLQILKLAIFLKKFQ